MFRILALLLLRVVVATEEACSSELDAASLLQAQAKKAGSWRSDMPVVTDVQKSFGEIQESPVVLVAPADTLPPNSYMTLTQHMQGIQRLQKSSYFAVPGNSEMSEVLMVKVGDDSTNAALASNLGGAPSSETKIASVLKIEKEFSHAGGISVWGDYLIVGAEKKCPISNWCGEASRVYVYDVSDPEKPKQMKSVIERPTTSAGASAMVEVDGGFVVLVGGWDSKELDFYKSSDLDSGFSKIATWKKEELLADAGMDANFGKYQNLNIVKQADGKLFLIGTTHDGTPGIGNHWADLFSLEVGDSRVSITKVASRKFQAKETDFLAGAGIFVADEQSLMLYSVPFNLKTGFIVIEQFS